MTREEWEAYQLEISEAEKKRRDMNLERNNETIELLQAELRRATSLLANYKGSAHGREVAEMTQMFRQIRRHTIELERGIRAYG